ncbi:MAG: ABC transporter ATP-binding protein [Nitrososphaerota archaeon]
MNSVLLSINNLKTYYYSFDGIIKAVDGISFDIQRKDIFGLVGESGCGKSTVALSILKLVPPPGRIVSGEIFFENEDILKKNEKEMIKIRGSKISMVSQDPSIALNPLFKIGEQIRDVIIFHKGLNKEEAYEIAIEKLKQVKLPEPEKIFERYPHELSGGMKQRAMIAMALACNPSLLIADEPTTALDVTIQAQILELLKELLRKMEMSVLLITHNFGIVAEICNKVAIMYAGKIIEMGSIELIFNNAFHPYTQGLLKAVPKISENIEELHVIEGDVPDLIDLPKGCRFHPRCSYAKDKCRKEIPEFIEIDENHKVSCFLYEK